MIFLEYIGLKNLFPNERKTNMELYPFKLVPFVSETVWGGRRLIDEYNVKTEKRNAAEAWVMSCHANGSSVIENGGFAGRSLREVFSQHPEIGGKHCADFSDFPVLIKLIDAAADLSVQVHPDDAYCAVKGAGAGKTESWYILDCEPGAYLLLGFKEKISKECFEQAIRTDTLTDYVCKVPVKKGDFFFIEAGTLHAICKGILLAEVQQNSDTTYRIYDYGRMGLDGKPRELHVADAVNVTRLEKYENPCKPTIVGQKTQLVSCPFFTEYVFETHGGMTDSADDDSFVSLLILDGEGKLKCKGYLLDIKKGDSVFLPAGCGEFELRGKMKILQTRV